ncbi:hypothetical protein, partial [Mesorhizobium sp. M7A.F.Ca.CA.001.12.2.1]|uniref:hypothetical protein n=1 Tax=Mesorhizobium sp. M7A.F.Ca.CA.001.12.2.1 TaxID=2496725 RepID=UPI0013DFABA8
GEHDIEKILWMARVLHFPKLNSSAWFDGSELDGIAHWGFRSEKWTMKAKPADRQPLPEVYGLAREAQKQAEVDLFRARANARFLLATGGRQHAQVPRRRMMAAGNVGGIRLWSTTQKSSLERKDASPCPRHEDR